MQLSESPLGVRLSDFGQINLGLTLDCGQAFRWEPLSEGAWSGVSKGHYARIIQDGSDLIFLGASAEAIENHWLDYLDLNTDYAAILENFSQDEHLSEAIFRYGCIRILRQEPWETLCSFIISSCNNIPRIKGIIHRLSENFGDKLEGGFYSFPSPLRLASLNEDDLAVIRAGYRSKAILDAARKLSSGELIIEELERLPYDELLSKLTTIYGVGQKVADCTILFGFGRHEVFPIDRHIQRITEKLYPKGLPSFMKKHAGIAQQYLFCLARGL